MTDCAGGDEEVFAVGDVTGPADRGQEFGHHGILLGAGFDRGCDHSRCLAIDIANGMSTQAINVGWAESQRSEAALFEGLQQGQREPFASDDLFENSGGLGADEGVDEQLGGGGIGKLADST